MRAPRVRQGQLVEPGGAWAHRWRVVWGCGRYSGPHLSTGTPGEHRSEQGRVVVCRVIISGDAGVHKRQRRNDKRQLELPLQLPPCHCPRRCAQPLRPAAAPCRCDLPPASTMPSLSLYIYIYIYILLLLLLLLSLFICLLLCMLLLSLLLLLL